MGSLGACSTFSWIEFSEPIVLSMSMYQSCVFSYSKIFLQGAISYYIVVFVCLPAGKVLHTRFFLLSQYQSSHQHAPMGYLGLLHALRALLMLWRNALPLAALGILRIFSARRAITMVWHHYSSTQMMMPSAIYSAVARRMSSTCPLFSYSLLQFTALAL